MAGKKISELPTQTGFVSLNDLFVLVDINQDKTTKIPFSGLIENATGLVTSGLQNEFSQINADISTLSGRIDGNDSDIQELQVATGNLENRYDGVDSNINTLETTTNNLFNSGVALENSTGLLSISTGILDDRVSDLEAVSGQLSSATGTLSVILEGPDINTQTGTIYSVTNSDQNKYIRMTNSNLAVVSVPSGLSFSDGNFLQVVGTQTGVNVVGEQGTNFNYVNDFNVFKSALIKRVDVEEYDVVGVGREIDVGAGPNFDSLAYDSSRDVGYFGAVSATDLISGTDLASGFSLTAGTAQNSDTDWLKFYVGSNAFCNRQGYPYILFVAKQTMRYDLSWNDIDGAGLVDGSSTTGIGGTTYSVRLMQGADADPSTYTFGTNCADNPGENSEWNELLYRVSEKIPDCSNPSEGMEGGNSTTRHGGPQNGSNWANFTNSELNVRVGNGRAAWCQEVDGPSPSRRVSRGFRGVADFSTPTASTAFSGSGWRPCLQISLQG